jgi:hypothetical protein
MEEEERRRARVHRRLRWKERLRRWMAILGVVLLLALLLAALRLTGFAAQ